MKKLSFLALLLAAPSQASAQTPATAIKLFEVFAPGYHYHVSCRVDITGTLDLPEEKGQKKQLSLTGTSAIEYAERVLIEKDKQIDRTIRLYRKIDFERKVGDQLQQSTLRPEARRLVILRHGTFEVPFCPTGPLTWGEIDLVRTDVFTPALAGLLPKDAVKPGDKWQADPVAVKELTDLERIEEGGLTCSLEAITTLVGRQQARIGFLGTVRGIGEDGAGRHQLEGHLFFDLVSNHISYVYVKGTHNLLDKNGQSTGKIEGTFTLTREPGAQTPELADLGLKGLTLEPNEDNTLLLYENTDLGVKFLYPRRWRVAGTSGRQVALDENRGSGLLITVDVPGKGMSAPQFHQEARNWMIQQKATVHRLDVPKTIAPGLDAFSADIELAKQRMWLDYFVVRQNQTGATVAARLQAADLTPVRKDVERIVKSVQLSR
ncbi:MAG: hypothetical protein HY040_14280 [Planctomycetes bacterium]|nr:hypothetical protein [Planctomycetota bacterium]